VAALMKLKFFSAPPPAYR